MGVYYDNFEINLPRYDGAALNDEAGQKRYHRDDPLAWLHRSD